MANNELSHSSGKANYEQYITSPSEITPASEEQRFQDKTAISYETKDIERYQVNRPKKDTIYAIIITQEQEKPCITLQETKTTE